ncbi:MAG: hypothetical protein JRI32_11260 [Deltaproteobacteria bacterium]|nr:hypothetical protein [Deltaproteobacteria bacterium]
MIPDAVWHEVVVDGEGQPGAEYVKICSWIIKKSVTNISLARALRQELDAGEAEAIALALPIYPVKRTDVARALKISRASVSKALVRGKELVDCDQDLKNLIE